MYERRFVDKDLSSALLGKLIDADILLILTAVDKVYVKFNTPEQKGLDVITIDEARKYIEAGEFAKGSMLPKVEACIKFVTSPEKKAIITSLNEAAEAIEGNTGTKIVGGN